MYYFARALRLDNRTPTNHKRPDWQNEYTFSKNYSGYILPVSVITEACVLDCCSYVFYTIGASWAFQFGNDSVTVFQFDNDSVIVMANVLNYSTIRVFSLILKALACVWNCRSLALAFPHFTCKFLLTIYRTEDAYLTPYRFLSKMVCEQIWLLSLVVIRHLNVDACSQNPRRVMNAQHGRQIPRTSYFTSQVANFSTFIRIAITKMLDFVC